MADGIKITYSCLKRLDRGFMEKTTASMKTNEEQTTPSRVKDTGVPKVQAQSGKANGTPGKRKEIYPSSTRRLKEEVNQEAISQNLIQETKDPEWQMVETKKTKKKKNKDKNGPKKV